MNLVLAAVVALLPPGDEENPEYGLWSGFQKGAWVRMRLTTGVPDDEPMELTTRLLDVTPEKVVLEVVMKGGRVPLGPAKRTVMARVERKAPDRPVIQEGDEELEVGGRKVKCRWSETVLEVSGQKITTRIWKTKEVPGGVVKSVSTGANTSTMRVVDWKNGE